MPKGKRGPKPKYDRAVFDRIFSEMAKGKTVVEILDSDSGTYPSPAAFYRIKKADPALQAEFEIAQELQCDYLAHRVMTLSRDVKQGDVIVSKGGKTQSSFYRDRLTAARDEATNLKWVLSRVDPRNRFTEKTAQQVTHAGRIDSTQRVITVTGGLPRTPLGSLSPEEREAAVREAAMTRVITRESITNPFGLDIAAIEAQDALDDATETELVEAEALERGPSPGDLAVLARMPINPADYDGDA
ncbi:hypothetical protein [Caballeronia sp. SBC1]|uniref:terminase small subunit-like protein n=1 Tax=Caballeronia sp. SBC1 TaxID=2705548 RepID=UPI00140E4119|nr:hypothetical protein [Caballeronia sp. SBC1]